MILRRALPTLLTLSLLQTAHAQIKVIAVEGDAELIRARGGAQSSRLVGGEEVSEKDRIITGMDSAVQLQFGGNSVVVVKELTDFKVGEFAQGEDSARTRLWLKAGEVSAEVNPNKSGASDFSVQTPTATCSVRGTGIDVAHANGQTQQRTRHGSAMFESAFGRILNNADMGAEADHEDGEFRSQSDQNLENAVVGSLPDGASDGEEDAVDSGGPHSNSGGAAPGDDAGAGASNDNLTGFVEEVNEDVFDELFGNNDLPDLPDPNDPDGGVGILTLVQLQARTGDPNTPGTIMPGTPPAGPDTFKNFSLPASSSAFDPCNPTLPVQYAYFVAEGTKANNQGLFRSNGGVVEPIFYKGSPVFDPIVGTITFTGFDFDNQFTSPDEPVLDSSDGKIVAFQGTFEEAASPGVPRKGIFVHDGDPGTGTVRVMVDDRPGTHGRTFTSISNHFSLDGFLINQPEVAFVGNEGGNDKVYFSKGFTNPGFSPEQAINVIGVGVNDANGFQADPNSGTSFRDLSYRISGNNSDPNNPIVRREVAFVGYTDPDLDGPASIGAGVFLAGLDQNQALRGMPGNGFAAFEPAQMIAHAGNAIPDSTGAAIAGSAFEDFRSVSISRNLGMHPGKVAFIGEGTIPSGNFQGIFTNVGANLTAVVDTNSSYTLAGFNGGDTFKFAHFDAVTFDGGIPAFSALVNSPTGDPLGSGLFNAPVDSNGRLVSLGALAGSGDIIATTNPAGNGTVISATLGINGADGAAAAQLLVDTPAVGDPDFIGIYQGGSPTGGPAIP